MTVLLLIGLACALVSLGGFFADSFILLKERKQRRKIMEALRRGEPVDIQQESGLFCERVRKSGYTPMIYASSTYLRDELDLTQLPYDIWVAEWTDKLSYQGPYRFWQYAADGQVDGITGNVDLDYMFGEYKL